MVASAAPQASPSSATGTSLSLPAAALPGDASFNPLFEHLGIAAHFISAVAQHVVVQGVRFSSQGDLDRGLVGQGALHGRSQDRHPQVPHVALLVHAVVTCALIDLLFAIFLFQGM